MRPEIIIFGVLICFCSCSKEPKPLRCGRMKVIIEKPLNRSVSIKSNIILSSYQESNPEIQWIESFDDYVAFEKDRVGEPYIEIYDSHYSYDYYTEELICRELLENCICRKTEIYYYWDVSRRNYWITFYLRVPCDSLEYSDLDYVLYRLNY